MPRSEAQNEALREESRRKIIEAALELFAQQGYAATSVRQIAQRAGIAQGLLYNYFAGKDELLRAIFERSLEEVRESFVRAGDDPDGPLAGLVRAAFAIVRRNQRFWQLSYGLRMQPEVLVGLAAEIQGWSASILSALEAILRQRGSTDPAIEARLLFALIDGAAQHYVLDPATYPLDAVAERIIARHNA